MRVEEDAHETVELSYFNPHHVGVGIYLHHSVPKDFTMASEEEREVVRVKVKKCDGALPVEFRSFAVDPQITSLEVLQHILIRAFDLNGRHSFGISFLSRDRNGTEMYLSLASDWDLDVAFVSAAKPYLQLKMDIKSSEESPVMEDWDIISTKDVIGSEQHLVERTKTLASAALPFTQSILSQVGRTLSRVQQALSWSYEEEMKPFMPPLSDAEFHSYLNGQGQLTRPEELRLRIYHGGVEPSLRKVVWRYLLNVYPDGLSGQERMDYMKRKTREYEQLKREWRAHVSLEDLEFIRGNVLKDVLRTDRSHAYYAGSEDSPHLAALTDLLTTFAITHPQISYCQGMSDIASPILAVMDNEAHAFICFCGIMKRLGGNFRPDGQLMSLKFQHLKLLLQYSDPEFYSYLVSRGADDLFFCYRWLLLELKREFAFDDALRMLEITWSSLPPDPPETEVELLGPPSEVDEVALRGDKGEERCLEDGGEHKTKEHRRHMLRPLREEFDKSKKPACVDAGGRNKDSDNHMANKKSHVTNPFERQSSFGEFKYYTTRDEDGVDAGSAQQMPNSAASKSTASVPRRQSTIDSDEDPGERTPLIRNCENGASPASSPLFRVGLPVWKTGAPHSAVSSPSPSGWPGGSPECSPRSPAQPAAGGSETFPRTVPKVWTSTAHVLSATGMYLPTVPALKKSESLCYPQHHSQVSSPVLSFGRGQSATGVPSSPRPESSPTKSCSLPPPQEFGKGNPFMLFLCLSILLEHRDHIIKNCLDYNELAMHFDRLVRRHNLSRVLQRAKALFADYLQSEIWDSEEGDEAGSDSPTSAALRPASPAGSDRPAHSPLASPRPSPPCSTYNLANTIPAPAAPVCYPSTL